MSTLENGLIVQAREADIDRLSRLIRDSFADVAERFELTPGNCPKHPSNCTPQWIERDLKRGVGFYILMVDDRAVGCVGIEQASPATCYMERLAVLPDQRGKGYGTRLVRHAMARTKAMGAASVGIGIIAADIGLKQFYRALGFVEGETKTFAHLPFEVAFMKVMV